MFSLLYLHAVCMPVYHRPHFLKDKASNYSHWSSTLDCPSVFKIYNRLATALVTFESLWYNHWKQNIDLAKNGLKATLFVHHPETHEILVNADEKLVQVTLVKHNLLKHIEIAPPYI